MSGPKRNPDKLNTIGVVVVGICGAVLVYVTIVALEAFYMNDTSEIQTMADYGGQDVTAKGHKAGELSNITGTPISNAVAPGMAQTFRIDINAAIPLVVRDAKTDPAHLIPLLPKADKPTIQPVFGRPKLLTPPAPPPTETGSAAAPAEAPTSPTGTTSAPQPVPGAGGHEGGSAAPAGGHAP